MIGSSGVVIPVLMAIGWFGDKAGESAGDVLPYGGLLLLLMILFISSSFKKTSEMSESIFEFVLCCLSFMKKVMFGPLDFLDILSSRMAFHTFSCSVTFWIRVTKKMKQPFLSRSNSDISYVIFDKNSNIINS